LAATLEEPYNDIFEEVANSEDESEYLWTNVVSDSRGDTFGFFQEAAEFLSN